MPIPGLPPAGVHWNPGPSLLQAEISMFKTQVSWPEPAAAALCDPSTPVGHIIGMKSKGAKPSAALAVHCCLEGALSCRAPCSSSPSFTFGDTTFPCFFFRHLPHHEVNEHTEVCNKTACQIHGDCGTLLDQTLQRDCLTAQFPATWKTSAPWKESMEGASCPVSKRMAGIVL